MRTQRIREVFGPTRTFSMIDNPECIAALGADYSRGPIGIGLPRIKGDVLRPKVKISIVLVPYAYSHCANVLTLPTIIFKCKLCGYKYSIRVVHPH